LAGNIPGLPKLCLLKGFKNEQPTHCFNSAMEMPTATETYLVHHKGKKRVPYKDGEYIDR
jgi:hypothetical protein